MQDSDSNDKTRTYLQLAKDTIVGHYRIVEKIGAGGMGEVYLAEDTKLNRKVALKFLPVHACQDADRRARFTREAQAAAKLNHPNIVTIYEVSEFNGRPFFAMENVEGQTFRELGKTKELPLSRIIELAIQVSEGLAKAHTAGIVHRDIKPSNLLIDQDGRAKIVDFGLASIHGSEHLTKTGSTLGTVGYMSPEQARGEDADARSDLFSFGVVLYELITGRAPFKAESDIATVKNIVEAVPEPLARYKNDVPDDLQRIIDKLLSKDRSLRYQHADDVATDLRRLVSSVSSGPTPVGRKRRTLIPSIVLLVVIGAAVVIFKPWKLVMKPADAGKTTQRVVVVPFKNQTGDPSLDPIGKMVADWTTQSLLGSGLAEVVPSEASRALDASNGLQSVAQATGATTIVTGSYYRLGDSIQFQAQVSDVGEKLLQAVEPIYTSATRVMDGVELVRQRVLGALMTIVDKRISGRALSRPPTYEAYLQYVQGIELVAKENFSESIPYFERAFALDSTFLSPLANLTISRYALEQFALADSTIRIRERRRFQMTPLEQLNLDHHRAQLAGNWMEVLVSVRAIAGLMPGVSNAYFNVGWAALINNRPKEAIEAFKKVDPDRIWVWLWLDLSEAYHLLNEHEKELEAARAGQRHFPADVKVYNAELEALAAMGKIRELRQLIENRPAFPQPGSTPAGSMRIAAIELRAHGHEDHAMKLLVEAIRWYESQPAEKLDSVRGDYAYTLYCARRWDEAKAAYEELVRRFPKDRAIATTLGLIAAHQGERAKAAEVSDRLRNLKLPYRFGEDTYQRGRIAAILGDKEQAVSLLRESFLQGKRFDKDVHRDLDFESLWNYPPFIEFLKPKE